MGQRAQFSIAIAHFYGEGKARLRATERERRERRKSGGGHGPSIRRCADHYWFAAEQKNGVINRLR